ncbi:MAG: alpha/beta fold hydrolase, partial [Candidatus Kariarchaeaceae archaeon]
ELELASMASAIDTIRTELNLDKISLMGHGIGGFVVQQYAIQFSSHVSSVILVNTSPNAKYRETMGWNIREKFNKVTRQALDQYRGETTEKSLRTRFTQSLATYFDPVNHDAAKELMDNASSIGTEAYVFLAQHVIPKVDFRKALRTVNVPVLVIAGTNDVWPSTSSQLFRNDMLQAEFEEFAGGHFLMIDNTDNFWNKIKEF